MKKDLSVETLRGLAIIFMVIGHVIGNNSRTGMKVSDDSFWRYFYYSFQYLRMPLFTVISGYVYALRPITSQSDLKTFFIGKFFRLIVPFMVVSPLFFLVQMITPGANKSGSIADIWKIYFFSYSHFWFIQAIIWIFVIIALLDKYNIIRNIYAWFTVLIITFFVSYLIKIDFNIFSFNQMTGILPFFILGVGIYRFKDKIFTQLNVLILVILAILSLTIQQYVYFTAYRLTSDELFVLKSIVAISGILILFKFRFTNFKLSYMGYYAFGIYLFHVFGTAGARILLKMIHVQNDILVFIFSLAMGLFLPILLEKFVNNKTLLKSLLFGGKYKKHETTKIISS